MTSGVTVRTRQAVEHRHSRSSEELAKNASSGNGTGHKLVIVESPAKAKTIAGYLGRGYVVESSIGHIRDLPQSAADVPAKIKGEPWARLGVDVDHDFTPYYVVSRDKKAHMTQAQGAAQGCLRAVPGHGRGPRGRGHRVAPVRRAEAQGAGAADGVPRDHPEAISAAVDNPREHRHGPRRGAGGPPDPGPALRLRGLPGAVEEGDVRPVCGTGAVGGHPAGRGPRAGAHRVPRPRRTGTSKAPSTLARRTTSGCSRPSCTRSTRGGWRGAATSPPWASSSPTRERRPPGPQPGRGAGRRTCPRARSRSARSRPSPTAVSRTRRSGPRRCSRRPPARSAGGPRAPCRWRNGSTRTASSPTCAPTPRRCRTPRSPRPGPRRASCTAAEYVPDKPRTYASKVKNAQEAHEAIRPAGENFRTPAQTGLKGDEFRLYELIWMRTVASQMKDAEGRSVDRPARGRAPRPARTWSSPPRVG